MANRPAHHGSFVMTVMNSATSWRMTGEHGSSTNAWQILTPEPPFVGSYGYNRSLFSTSRVDRFGGGASLRIPSLNILSLREQASIPVMLDATEPMPDLSRSDSGPRANAGRGGGPGLNPFVMARHGRETNGMFLDFSVRKVGLKELWTLKWGSDFDRAGPWTRAGGVQPQDWPQWMHGLLRAPAQAPRGLLRCGRPEVLHDMFF
jgi:hypothetical protein